MRAVINLSYEILIILFACHLVGWWTVNRSYRHPITWLATAATACRRTGPWRLFPRNEHQEGSSPSFCGQFNANGPNPQMSLQSQIQHMLPVKWTLSPTSPFIFLFLSLFLRSSPLRLPIGILHLLTRRLIYSRLGRSLCGYLASGRVFRSFKHPWIENKMPWEEFLSRLVPYYHTESNKSWLNVRKLPI